MATDIEPEPATDLMYAMLDRLTEMERRVSVDMRRVSDEVARLRAVVAKRPVGAVECKGCGGSGRVRNPSGEFGSVVCPGCHGAGLHRMSP